MCLFVAHQHMLRQSLVAGPRAKSGGCTNSAGSKKVFEMCRNLKTNRFRKFILKPAVIHCCLPWRPSACSTLRGASDAICLRAIVPWHPALRSLSLQLRLVAEQWQSLLRGFSHGLFAPQLGVSFALASRPLHVVCRVLKA